MYGFQNIKSLVKKWHVSPLNDLVTLFSIANKAQILKLKVFPVKSLYSEQDNTNRM